MTENEKTSGPVIRPLLRCDLPTMALVHCQAFPKAAMTLLGYETVRRYYEWQMFGPHQSITLGAFWDGRLVGFCVGGTFQGSLAGFVRKNKFFLVGNVLLRPWLIFAEEFRQRLSLALSVLVKKRISASPKTSTRAASVPSFGILAICTDPKVQGGGIGKLLMSAAEGAALERDFDLMHLSVHPSNVRAVLFYERLGWKRVLNDQEWTGQMSKVLRK